MGEMKLDVKTSILLGIFVALLILANLLGSKVISIFGLIASVGIFVYPVTFLITDIVAEVHGRRLSLLFVYVGFIALLVTLVYTFIGIYYPPASIYTNNDAYRTVFSNSLRVVIASLTAFLISQTHDIWAFHFWKKKTNGKHLWIRNNLSTIVSQFIDTVIFMFIAFYQVAPQFTALRVWYMIVPYWLIKVGFALADTPFVYLGVKWLKSKS